MALVFCFVTLGSMLKVEVNLAELISVLVVVNIFKYDSRKHRFRVHQTALMDLENSDKQKYGNLD